VSDAKGCVDSPCDMAVGRCEGPGIIKHCSGKHKYKQAGARKHMESARACLQCTNNTRTISIELETSIRTPSYSYSEGTTVRMKMTVCRVLAPWSPVKVYRSFRCVCCLCHQGAEWDGGSKHLWNVGKLLPDYTTGKPRRRTSSLKPSWEPEVPQEWDCVLHYVMNIFSKFIFIILYT
jgi:hypothetical protein